jgi:spermidine synthase
MTFSKSSPARLTYLFTFVSFAIAAAPRIIYKDVAILGGGASGSHAAVRLREDFNKSVIVVEKQENLVSFSSYLFSLTVVFFCSSFLPNPSAARI